MEPELTETTGAQVVSGGDAVVAVPSGQVVVLQEVIWNVPGPSGLAIRFRFVAPAIAKAAGGVDFGAASADMMHLCQTYARTRLAEFGPQPSQIIISMADRALPFGDAAPEATQFFMAYRLENDACILEVF